MCAHSPESQPCPGLHPEQCGQQAKGGDSPPLLCSHDTPPAVLCPALGAPMSEGHGPAQAGPEEAMKMIRGLEQLPCEDRLRVGGVQPGEEKALERPYSGLPVLKGGTGKVGRETLSGGVGIGRGLTALI